MLSIIQVYYRLLVGLPTLHGIYEWLTGEVKYLIAGGLVVMIALLLATQKIKKFFGFIILAAIALFIVSDVIGFLENIKAIIQLIFSAG